MNIAKLKSAIPTLNKDAMIGGIKTADQKTLILGISGLLLIYTSIFKYIWMQSEKTITNYKSSFISETVPIQKKEHETKNNQKSAPQKTYTELAIKGLYENHDHGLLPIIRKSDSFTSFRAFQHNFSFKDIDTQKPVLSFIVMDYGLSKSASEKMLDILPPQISLMISPYDKMPNEWIKMAKDKGHEVWLNTPIQNRKQNTIGTHTLYHHDPLPNKRKTLFKTLMRAQGYTGIASFTDKSLIQAGEEYTQIMDEVYKRGLGYIELNPNASRILQHKADLMGAPYMKANINIYKMTGDKNSFDALEIIAKKNGHAIAVIPNYPKAIKNLAAWVMKIGHADYTIAPVSAIYDLPSEKSSKTEITHSSEPSPLTKQDHIEPEHHNDHH